MANPATIPILVRDQGGVKAGFSAGDRLKNVDVPVEKLKDNFEKVTASLLTILGDLKQVGDFKLKEVEVQVEVSAEGGVNLVGIATVAGKGSITLKFEKD